MNFPCLGPCHTLEVHSKRFTADGSAMVGLAVRQGSSYPTQQLYTATEICHNNFKQVA